MKSLSQLLFWVSNFACLPAFISAEGNLRGSQGTEKNPKLQMDRMLKIIGPDDRIKIDVQSEPLHAVGVVYFPEDSNYCTGVMVGRDLMLTALDCLNKTDDGTSFKQLVFIPEYSDEGDLPHAPATAVEPICSTLEEEISASITDFHFSKISVVWFLYWSDLISFMYRLNSLSHQIFFPIILSYLN